MREIKFRAWDGEYMLTNLDSVCLEAVRDGVIESEEGESIVSCAYMQFTGLVDKNGVEIYEGDMIIWKEEAIKFEVKWSNEDCGYVCMRDNCSGSMNQQYLDHFELIGSIHENPELLEASK